jgi:hydroxymethylglutaryl-CoA lyase
LSDTPSPAVLISEVGPRDGLQSVTEDLVFMFEAMGVPTGIDIEKLIAAPAPLLAGLPGEPVYGMTPQAVLPKGFVQGALHG